MAYTTINKPSEYFNTKLYTGNGSTQSITGVGHQPDLVWIKHRNNATAWNHSLHDSVRGSTKYITSNGQDQEITDANSVTSFNSDGFSIGTFVKINDNGVNHVAWNWKANGAGSSNTDGSITSTVSANTTSGFSIVSYTGNATDGATVGHGLGAAPACIIIKNTTDSSSAFWCVYHQKSFVSQSDPGVLYLNDTGARSADTNVFGISTVTINSNVFSLGNYNGSNGSGDAMIAYCFAEKKSFSKFGSYTGNGNADGPFIYTGFKPAFIITKKTSAIDNWILLDNKRDAAPNPHKLALFPNTADVEAGDYLTDFLSNGFKIRSATGSLNTSSASYIYMAFAENPLVGTNGIPATAR